MKFSFTGARLRITSYFTQCEDFAFDYQRLAIAIEIRDRSYQLLMWIGSAIDKGLVLPSRAAHHSGGPEAAIEWLRSNFGIIPEHIRPEESSIDEFAAFFSTYLTSSFDVVQKPGTRGEGPIPRFGCTCDLCVRIINAPHLQAKKIFTRDKRRAELLMSESMQDLATEHGLQLTEQHATQLVTNERTRRAAAYITYGKWLILRLNGESDGPAILALWRIIAWDPRGGMRSGFTLELNDFRAAESVLIVAIQSVK